MLIIARRKQTDRSCHNFATTALPWNYLWRPRKYDEKKHDKIAEKYNLHPKEYKPYPPEKNVGDYPALPMIGPAAKDPYYPYDIPSLRKNYHEPVSDTRNASLSEMKSHIYHMSFLLPVTLRVRNNGRGSLQLRISIQIPSSLRIANFYLIYSRLRWTGIFIRAISYGSPESKLFAI